MGKQTFERIKKMLSILLAIFFIVTLTVASASAAESNANDGCKNGACNVGGCHDGMCNYRPAGTFTTWVASTTVTAGGTAATGGN